MKNLFRTLSCFLVVGNLFAAIAYTPVRPNVEQQITFTVTHPDGISGDEVLWDFGDGSAPLWSTSTVIYTYLRTGTFLVKATYSTLKQQQVTDQISLTVFENRKIRVSPLYPVPDSPTTFTAENFLSNNILWDFGDGTPPQCTVPVVNHTYSALGKYTVKARDWCGNSQVDITLQINVTEPKGPRAAFQISYIQLRFDDGKSYKVVEQNAPLMAFADIKYEGSGILQALWLVDGVPFRQVALTLPFAKETVINSGEIPGLPTNFFGLHEVTLKIINPVPDFEVPILRYFVAAPVSGLEMGKRLIFLTAIEALDKEGRLLNIGSDSIRAPGKDGIMIKAKIRLAESLPGPSICLLRVYLNNQLVDEQILRDLRPDLPREIISSITEIPTEAEKFYLTIYDISKKPPELLFLKRVDIVR